MNKASSGEHLRSPEVLAEQSHMLRQPQQGGSSGGVWIYQAGKDRLYHAYSQLTYRYELFNCLSKESSNLNKVRQDDRR